MSILPYMNDTDYSTVAAKALIRYAQLVTQREELDIEIAKLNQFLRATINLLSDEDKQLYAATLAEVLGSPVGLADAIRQVLKTNALKWLTVSEIRDRLKESGFDFSGYMANPLASVSTTIRRMKDG